MSSLDNPVQKAIYDKLVPAGVVDAQLTALGVTGVFDHVPQRQAFPYVQIGDDTDNDWSTFATDGGQVTVTIHAWSREKGRKQANAILSRVHDLLYRQSLTIAGFTHVFTDREFGTTFLDPDGITYHGVRRFRVWVHA